MTLAQMHNLRLLLAGLAAGTIHPANVPLMTQLALENLDRAIAAEAAEQRARLKGAYL